MSRPMLLALRALGLGDLLTAVPALRGLAREFPHHRRLLAAPAALAPVLELIRDPGGSRVVDGLIDAAPLAPLSHAPARPAVAVNLHGCGAQSHRLLLALRPRRLLAFAHREVSESAGGPAWRAGEHEVSRWCRMLSESGVTCEEDDLHIECPPLERTSLPAGLRGATVIHPGAASPARRWPADRFARLAAAERAAGRRVFITGAPGEVALARRLALAAGLDTHTVLAGRTGLRELAAAVGAAGRIVCGDTGVAHLATALGTPSLVLFGPVPPHEWGPPRGRGAHRVLWKGRRGDPHAPVIDPGLDRIGVDEVLTELARLAASADAR